MAKKLTTLLGLSCSIKHVWKKKIYKSLHNAKLLSFCLNIKKKFYFFYSRGLRNDASLVPPIRQTASIFKQPVTVIKTQPNSKVKLDFKHSSQDKHVSQEKPKQVSILLIFL